jgi:hypothetical protein
MPFDVRPKMTCLNPKPSLRDEKSLELVINFSARWIKAGVFESFVHNLRAVLRIAEAYDLVVQSFDPTAV